MSEKELEIKLNEDARRKNRIDVIKAAVIKVKRENNRDRGLNLHEVDYHDLGNICVD